MGPWAWQWGWPAWGRDLIALGSETILNAPRCGSFLPSPPPLLLVFLFSQKFAEQRKEKKRIFVCARPKELKIYKSLETVG